MHISVIKSVQNGKTYRSTLLRASFRDKNNKVQKKTLLNLSPLPDEAVEMLRAHFAGRTLVEPSKLFRILRSRHHGAIHSVLVAFRRLGFARLLASRPSRERDLVCSLVAARIVRPDSKLATARWFASTTLPDHFRLRDVAAEDLYAAMDWLLRLQNRIQGKLARRHLADGGLVLLDLTSSYFEGSHCPLARFGHSRDGRRGKLQVNYGLLCDVRGRPVAVQVFAGNVGDPRTVGPAVRQLRKRFGLSRVVLVGDRGMLVQARIDDLRKLDGIDWISALRSGAIRKLQRDGRLDRSDETGLFEIHEHPDYPGERLVACRNAPLANRRAHKREDLLAATERQLAPIRERVAAGRLKGAAKIGLKVGEVINRYKVRKHFQLQIGENSFAYDRNQDSIEAEAALDGIYVIRTSLTQSEMAADDCVRSYKALTRVERAFRTMKTTDLRVRPIRHWRAERVKAHLFLCMLAYYVEWHMRENCCSPTRNWPPGARDPVAPASRQRVRNARRPPARRRTASRCTRTLLADLHGNACTTKGADSARQNEFDLGPMPRTRSQTAGSDQLTPRFTIVGSSGAFLPPGIDANKGLTLDRPRTSG